MGGFHGGHHSGGSHGGFRAGGGYHYHTPVHVYHGYYSNSNNRSGPKTDKTLKSKTLIIIGSILVAVSAFIFLSFYLFESTATIYKVFLIDDVYDRYWTYDFTYSWLGQMFYGHGDDDFHTMSDFRIGDQYPVYASILFPSNYQFSDTYNFLVIAISAILLIIGISEFVVAAKQIRLHSSIEEIHAADRLREAQKEEKETNPFEKFDKLDF